jgi:serine/threonine-protein kinase ULK/ATG1
MKKLNHPHIIKLYDVVTTANSIYLIMEYCAGGDLKRYCRNRKITEEEATLIIKNIAKGFQQIVQQGIIHRDLKPANILVHEGVFKICDFGFAKFFQDASRMTRTCVGTPIYMSPQVLAQKSYTDKADVWSLGVLYY